MKTYRADPNDADAVAHALLEKYRDQHGQKAGCTQSGCTIELADFGQDFLEFDIKGGVIIATRPFQGFVWDGQEVLNETISVGDHIVLRDPRGEREVRYPVVDVKPLAGPA